MPNNYSHTRPRPRWLKRVLIIVAALIVILVAGGIIAQHQYSQDLLPANPSGQSLKINIVPNTSAGDIASQLAQDGIIRSEWAFNLYTIRNGARGQLKAGVYKLSPRMSVGEIVSILTRGKVATNLVTIFPGERLDQVKETLIDAGFKPADVAVALEASTYPNNPALVDKPKSAGLEGFLYPDSFAKESTTKPQLIVEESLGEMAKHLTPDIRAAFAKEGLNVYQGVTLASIVEQEASNPKDRAQVAQVFLSRLKTDSTLGSDVTALYGAIKAGLKLPNDPAKAAVMANKYDSPYNTHLHTGLPPGPISNVDASALAAVAHPAHTDWLYFVAGHDCKIHFAKTLAGHEENIKNFGSGCSQQE